MTTLLYDPDVTKRVTVSLPDDVAAYLETFTNASAAVTRALRAQMHPGRTTEAMLRAAGFNITAEGKARIRAAMPPFTEEEKAEYKRRRDLLDAGLWTAEENEAARLKNEAARAARRAGSEDA